MNKDTDHIQAVTNNSQPGKLPVLLQQVKDNSVSILLAHLENLFGSCDDLFFDLSSRAATNSEQNLYFESMREIRLKKHGVIAAFKGEIEAGFHSIATDSVAPSPYTGTKADEEFNHNNLSLVQNDVLEQDVAISSMISKARINCQEGIYHINLRFDYLAPNIAINENNNPIDPQQICGYFAEASKTLELNIKARIILFKQFERLVASKLTTLYSAANSLLIEAGVMPKARQHKRGSTSPVTQHTNTEQQNVELELNELNNLFANLRQQSPEALATIIPNYTAYATNPGPAMANEELLQLLTIIQQSTTPTPTPSNFSDQEQVLTDSLRHIIESILSNQGKEPERALQQPDDDVINLVAMFFDFVLDDRNLPVPVQALISRLQIPVLKIALRDKTFFSNGNHPARKLINAIAESGIGWDDSTQPEKDKLYDLLTSITQEINDKYANDSNIFTDKLATLQIFNERTEHKSNLVSKRTEQVAEGQAKTKLAKRVSQNTMFEKLEGAALPESISEFLTQHWLNLLIMTHLRHGDESPEWIDAIQLIDDLTWASLQHKDDKSHERFEKIKPGLLKRVAAGMDQIAVTKDESIDALDIITQTLEKLHAVDTDSALLIRPLSAEQAKELGHTPGSGSKNWKDMTGVERQQARYKQLTYDYIRKAEELPLGTWLSYTDHKSGNIIRCKLVSKIEASDSYVFVNRFGFKALEKARKDFAYDMQAGRAQTIDNSRLFDRAMESVLDKLNMVETKRG